MFILHSVCACLGKYQYRRGCKKAPSSAGSHFCVNGTTGRTDCICSLDLCGDKGWTNDTLLREPDPAYVSEAPTRDESKESDMSVGAVMIVDAMLMFLSFIISQLL